MKDLIILGSTGSIGRSALDVARRLPEEIRVVGLAANTNWEVLRDQIGEFRPRTAAMVDADAFRSLRESMPDGPTEIVPGLEGILEGVLDGGADIVLAAITGAAGLPTTLRSLEGGGRLALANKESLVMAGERLTDLARKKGAEIVPVDSEHSAIFQALLGGKGSEVERLILTASGGPFRETPAAEMERVTPEEALNHPTWKMGPKITIDSATLMNKALEIIEARWLFGMPPDKIDVVIHPQSIVHSLVEYHDGSMIAQMGTPDMRVPIQFALTYPDRRPLEVGRVNLEEISRLTFEAPDRERFPALDLAYSALRAGGTAPAVLNGANEQAVDRFLKGAISLPRISGVVREVLERHDVIPTPDLDAIAAADRWAREEVLRSLST